MVNINYDVLYFMISKFVVKKKKIPFQINLYLLYFQKYLTIFTIFHCIARQYDTSIILWTVMVINDN